MNKRINVTIVLAVILCGLTACKPQSMEDAKPKNDQSHKTSHKSHEKVLKDDSDKTPAEIDQKKVLLLSKLLFRFQMTGLLPHMEIITIFTMEKFHLTVYCQRNYWLLKITSLTIAMLSVTFKMVISLK